MLESLEEQLEAEGGINGLVLDPSLLYRIASYQDADAAEIIWTVSAKFCTPKHWAAQLLTAAAKRNNHGPLVIWLLEKGAKANGPTPRLNALAAACSGSAERNVALLLAAGADPNARDGLGRTPLEILRSLKPCGKNLTRRRAEIVELLVKSGVRLTPADLQFLKATRRSVGLGARTEILIEEIEIGEATGSARIAPRQRSATL